MQVGGVEGERARLVSRASEGHTDSIFFERSPPACRRFAPRCGPDRDCQPDPVACRLSPAVPSGGGALVAAPQSLPQAGVRNPA